MHRWTYLRLSAAAIKAQERALGLEIDEARRRFPGLFTPERGFPLTQDAAAPAKRSDRFFTPRALAAWSGRNRDVPRHRRRGPSWD
jgi:hypothetical protein